MKKPILLPLLFISSLSISGATSAFGLAEALKDPIQKVKKEANQIDKEKDVKKSREVKKIEKILANWATAFNNKDIDTLLSFYDENIMYATTNSGLIKGLDDVKAWHENYFLQMNGKLHFITESITEAGTMGAMGTVVLKYYIEPNEANSDKATKGRAMLVFKKKAFGKWLLLYNMEQSAPDVLVKDFQ